MNDDTESPAIDWRGSIPYASRFDDLYYSADDPVGEVRHTFLGGTAFDALCGQKALCIAETGFGTGLNFLEAWGFWEETASNDACLDFFSVEAFPLSKADLVRAHAAFPQHAQRAEALQMLWPGAVPGIHRLSLAQGRVRLLLAIGEAGKQLSEMSFQADAWFLDGFAPAKNPEMWRPEVLSELARLSRPGTRLATFTAAGQVRRGLAAVGFKVEKRPGFGRKRDCVTAQYEGTAKSDFHAWNARPPPLTKSARIAVVGAGIAGTAAVRALRRTGRNVVHVGGAESRSYAASTLPLALIAPKLVRGDQPFPVFWRQAFHDAVRELDTAEQESGETIWQGPRGLLIPGSTPEKLEAQRKLLTALGWPESEIRPVSAKEATQHSDLQLNGGVFVSTAGNIDAATLLRALAPPPDLIADFTRIENVDGRWSLYSRNTRPELEADAVLLAGGAGTASLLTPNSDAFGMRIGAGQMLTARPDRPIGASLLQDGYVSACDPGQRTSLGATAQAHAPLVAPTICDEPTKQLIERHRTALDGRVLDDIQAWTGLRCDTRDHLPLIGPVQDFDRTAIDFDGLKHGKKLKDMPEINHQPGLFTLAALGARGFQGAFLGADIIVSYFDGRPLPVSSAVAKGVLPARFQVREITKSMS